MLPPTSNCSYTVCQVSVPGEHDRSGRDRAELGVDRGELERGDFAEQGTGLPGERGERPAVGQVVRAEVVLCVEGEWHREPLEYLGPPPVSILFLFQVA